MITCRARQLAFMPGPSSSLISVLCRSLATQTNNANERPQMFQLDHVRARLEFTRSSAIYGPSWCNQRDLPIPIPSYRNGGKITHLAHTAAAIMKYDLTVANALHKREHIDALNIVPILEDGTVRLRWRVKHISLLRALTNPMLFKYDYRIKRLKWFDGYSIFVVDGNGLVYKVINQRVMPDEERGIEKKTATQRLAEKIGVLPEGAQAACSSLPRQETQLQ